MRERGRVCERVRGRQGETGRQGEGEIEKKVRERLGCVKDAVSNTTQTSKRSL